VITFSESQQKIVDLLEAVNRAHWIDHHNGAISCSDCHAWFYKDDRYSYMHYCPYCGAKMEESEK
jgi:Zn finger protein HypA/HybF involved in hydrogenase expression